VIHISPPQALLWPSWSWPSGRTSASPWQWRCWWQPPACRRLPMLASTATRRTCVPRWMSPPTVLPLDTKAHCDVPLAHTVTLQGFRRTVEAPPLPHIHLLTLPRSHSAIRRSSCSPTRSQNPEHGQRLLLDFATCKERERVNKDGRFCLPPNHLLELSGRFFGSLPAKSGADMPQETNIKQ